MINKLSGAMLAALVLATPVLAGEAAPPRPPGGSGYVNNGPALNAAALVTAARVILAPAEPNAPPPCGGCTWGGPLTNGPALNGSPAAQLYWQVPAAAETEIVPPTRSGGGGYIGNGPGLNAVALVVAAQAVSSTAPAEPNAPRPCIGCEWGGPLTNGPALNAEPLAAPYWQVPDTGAETAPVSSPTVQRLDPLAVRLADGTLVSIR